MARRVNEVTISREGRDKGKTFVITEMSASAAEEWFSRAMMLLARSGAEVSPDIFNHGAAAFAAMGIAAAVTGLGKAPFGEVKVLLHEMFGCVAFKGPNGMLISERTMVDSQIEEVSTRLQLREEVLSLHLGFSLTARLSGWRERAAGMISDTSTTSTSTAASAPSSGHVSRRSKNSRRSTG